METRRRLPIRLARRARVTAGAATRASRRSSTANRVTGSQILHTNRARHDESDDGNSEMSESGSVDFDTEDSERISSRLRKRPAARAAPSTRHSKRSRPGPGYYGEPDSDSDILVGEESSLSDEDELADGWVTLRPRHLPSPSLDEKPSRAAAGTSKVKKHSASKGSRPTGGFLPQANPGSAEEEALLGTAEPETIPPWESLPYLILELIFEFASTPVHSHSNVKWLLSTSTVCTTFAEPALSALYKRPPFLNRTKALSLVKLLAMEPSTTRFNYRQKIECLVIDVGNILSSKSRQLDLGELVPYLPGLKKIALHHQKDTAPYRQLDSSLKWQYPPSLFTALGVNLDSETTPSTLIRLKSWRWNRRMMGDLSLSQMQHVHTKPAFNGLRHLAFLNFQVPSLPNGDTENLEVAAIDKKYIEDIATALAPLQDLRILEFESSTIVTGLLLSLLPGTIEHLRLVNCWDVTAGDLRAYLQSHGRALRSLVLDHCQSLSLEFLPDLCDACPNLETLFMNLSYYKIHEFYRDSDPNYEFVLGPTDIPQWPSSLITLNIQNMRRLDADTARMFFKSLEDSAASLPNLRALAFKVILDIPWRQRCKLRDQWSGRLEKVFLRRAREPLPLRSIKPPTLSNDAPITDNARQEVSFVRQSPHITTQSRASSRASSVGRELRRPDRGRISYAEPGSDIDENEDEDGIAVHESSDAEAFGFIQGKCETVDIIVGNQKPTEIQYRMTDFLDEESQSQDDADWAGDQDPAEDQYAW